MPSFDVVSALDMQEVRNAVDQARPRSATASTSRARTARVDLDDTGLTLRSSTEDRLAALRDVLEEKLVRRKVSLKALDRGKVEEAAGGRARSADHAGRRERPRRGAGASRPSTGVPLRGSRGVTRRGLRARRWSLGAVGPGAVVRYFVGDPMEYDLSNIRNEDTAVTPARLLSGRVDKIVGRLGQDGRAILVDRLDQVKPLDRRSSSDAATPRRRTTSRSRRS